MVDTQRFAIWHPPGMPTEVKKPAPVPIPEQPQPLNRNIENMVKDYKWTDSFNAAKSSPVPTSRPRIQSVSYPRPSVAPRQVHLTPHPSKADEDGSESSSEEEVVRMPLVMARKFSSSSPPKPILSSTPVNSNLSNSRPKPTERVSFALPKETPKENESNFPQTRARPIEKPASQGSKTISKPPSPPTVQFPEQPKQTPGFRNPVGLTETRKDPTPELKPPMKSSPPIESRRITPPDSKTAIQRNQEIPKPVPAAAPMLASSQFGRRPLAPVNDQGFVTRNALISLDAFLIHLQDEAFDTMKLTIMEASIRQFHLIAADADVQLTRKLCSIKTANVAEKRQALIQEHNQFMEAQATSLLTDMSVLHDQLKERQTTSTRGLFDIPVDEGGLERSLPPSTASWSSASPPNQPELSDSWRLPSSLPKTVEVPRHQPPPPKPNPEPESTMPSFWKPSWDPDFTEPPTPQVPPISKLVTVEDASDEDDDPEPPAPAPIPVPKKAKPATVPVRQPTPLKTQLPSVADEPTPIWGQPWRKGKPQVSNTSSNQATTSAQVSPPLPPVIEKSPTPPPVTAPAPEPAPVPVQTPSPTQTKPKTAKQLRAERNRKGKNKATATVTKEDVAEEQEEVLTPPQQSQPPASRKTGVDMAINNMVNTGNVQSALEQLGLAWR